MCGRFVSKTEAAMEREWALRRPPGRANALIDESLPICDLCGGTVKTATISFGQAMPEAAMERAKDETLAPLDLAVRGLD